MFTKLVKNAAALLLISSAVFAQDGIYFNAAQGDKDHAYMEMIEGPAEDIGFVLSDPHEHIDKAYAEKYSKEPGYKKTLDNLGFFSITNDAALRPLLLKEPKIGGFSPFNLHIYKYVSEDITRVGHVNPAVMLDIVGISDKEVRTAFIDSFKPLDKLVDEKIGGKEEVLTFDTLPKNKLMEFEMTFDRPAGVSKDDIIDGEFEGLDIWMSDKFEAAFEDKKYIIAGFKNFAEAYRENEQDFEKYDSYVVYSLCHFYFSYGVFNHGNAQAGAFAPCSMYMYVEKGSNVLKIGMPYLENWINVAGIKDKKQIASIRAIDKEIIEIMESIGAKLK
ncbi:hypothetical protein JHD50_03505 [Sulfurimonas sp. MAG313]|nr:hypothetical protein [Sulfurimonas sp. MAG313]MDF1880378.1 hypothetical protein [Sulfurimonas sp. MAG313]